MISASSFGMDSAGRMARMRRIGDVILAEWKAEARGVLRATLTPYIQALAIRSLSEREVSVCLPAPGVDGKIAQLARIAEFGMGAGGIGTSGPYDVRTFLLRGTTKSFHPGPHGACKVKGPHVHVPFGFRQMDVGLVASGGPVGSQAAVQAASALKATTSDGHRTIWGGRLPQGMAEKLKPHNVTDPLHGMIRRAAAFSSKGGKTVTQTTGFSTFRTASWGNTDPMAWRSSGVTGRRIGDKIASRLSEILKGVL